ncbi:phosphoribosylformylglycinamidine cyclo-ligase [Aureibacillus halotolerans]|uniref:Phosphoribosylformylglycinamidine cyclo-ligase n=1 Tax=Aureibacillus halotolerans TaxID=1508390 RepID=A0A4R6TTP4_9BACI|nr:phosphoribosylformylglycinamidine cyclo-ligase [Aureibacillus halotolerans]TDQ34150.1 phosphoribosylformylglycinamidine cyclo-ligase [Aureibacillus halotolerans]
MSNAYKSAGVDVEAGYESVERIKQHAAKTMRPEVLAGLGGFGGLFDLSQSSYKEPVLVSGTDGVGTKLKLAFDLDRHDTIGIDAVAMCVNDIVAQGAEPLFFLDYIACGKQEPVRIEAIVKGVADGCQMSGCALIGGETAEMPGMYDPAEYDIAGFAVGIAEKSKLVTGNSIQPGQKLIGLASSGVHSNGFSLVRKLLTDNGIGLSDKMGDADSTVGETLLTPTKIYAKSVLEVLKQVNVHGMAHVTGGGFYENLPRMMPEGAQAVIQHGSWEVPPVFSWLQQTGGLSQEDMFGTFNMGIGFVLAVDEEDVAATLVKLEDAGEKAYVIGDVAAGTGISFRGATS